MGYRKNTLGVIGRCAGVGILIALVGCGDSELHPKTPLAITSDNADAVVAKVAEMNDLVTGVGTSSGQAVAANLTATSGTRTAPTFTLPHIA